MKGIMLLVLSLVAALTGKAQEIYITFSPACSGISIDSIHVTNLNQRQSITIPGQGTLVLNLQTGFDIIDWWNDGVSVIPNPFSGVAMIAVDFAVRTSGRLSVMDLTRRELMANEYTFEVGSNLFNISLRQPGVFVVILETHSARRGMKIVNTAASVDQNRIEYLGVTPQNQLKPVNSVLKTCPSIYQMNFELGDQMLYTVYSGLLTSILSDSPSVSQNYEVELSECQDADGKNYKTVLIGQQMWMAENLAWLPSVSPSAEASDEEPKYYVYDYEGSSVAEAKEVDNWNVYGVLYNYDAAKTACPTGWHLPEDEEWKILETYMGMGASELDVVGWRNVAFTGKKLKSVSGWGFGGNGSNSSGFFALPAGYRSNMAGFANLGYETYFWSSSEIDTKYVWYRNLYYSSDGVQRNYNYRFWGFSVRCIRN